MSILFPFLKRGDKVIRPMISSSDALITMHSGISTKFILQYVSVNASPRCVWYGIGETRKQILEGLKYNEVQYGDDQGDVQLKGGYLNVRVAVLGVYEKLTFDRV